MKFSCFKFKISCRFNLQFEINKRKTKKLLKSKLNRVQNESKPRTDILQKSEEKPPSCISITNEDLNNL